MKAIDVECMNAVTACVDHGVKIQARPGESPQCFSLEQRVELYGSSGRVRLVKDVEGVKLHHPATD